MKRNIFLAALVILLTCSLTQAFVSSNLEVQIPEEYRSIKPGEELVFTTKLMNLADLGRRDVTLKYEILNEQEDVISSRSETVAVQTQASFVGNIPIPENVAEGTYNLRVSAVSEKEGSAETEKTFQIYIEKPDYTPYYPYIIIALIAIIIIAFISLKGQKTMERIFLKSKIKSMIRKKLSQ